MTHDAAYHGAPALSHLFIHVGDLGPLRRFYVDALGLPMLHRPDGYVRIGSAAGFHLGAEVVADLPGPDEIELVVRVPDVDASFAALTAHDAAVVDAPPSNMPWGLRQIWTRDPNGLRVSVYTPQPTGI